MCSILERISPCSCTVSNICDRTNGKLSQLDAPESRNRRKGPTCPLNCNWNKIFGTFQSTEIENSYIKLGFNSSVTLFEILSENRSIIALYMMSSSFLLQWNASETMSNILLLPFSMNKLNILMLSSKTS